MPSGRTGVSTVYFGEPVADPQLWLRVTDTAPGAAQGRMHLQRQKAGIQIVCAVNGIIYRQPIFSDDVRIRTCE
jgi:hypothetical protein